MKSFFRTAAHLTIALSTSVLHAQEAPLPQQSGTPTTIPQLAVTPAPPAPQLIPDDILPAPRPDSTLAQPAIPTLNELDASLQSPPPSAATDAYRKHIAWRKLRNQVQNEPQVRALLSAARTASTDLEKRNRLREYYELFYGRMIALAAADLKPYLRDRKREALGALPQPRVRPESVPSPSPGLRKG